MASNYVALHEAAKSLCDDFAQKANLPTLLDHFSTSPETTAFEHGDPHFAPFLGREFKGRAGIEEYFTHLQKLLSYKDMSFSEYFVDETERKVSVKGKANFTWLETNKSWNEIFNYVLDFTNEEGNLKVSRYQVWADTGALYLARMGKSTSYAENL